MSKKTAFQQQVERETGLNIEKIDTLQQLDDYLDHGLAQLYRSVFTEPPYLENFSIEEAKTCFRDYLKEGGFIFVASDQDMPVSFLVTVPLKAHIELASKTAGYIDADKATYFADAGVDPAYRQRNISVKMKQILFEANKMAGYKQGLSRTSEKSYKQISAFNKVGGKVLSGLFQDVASKRLDGSAVTDRRVFYIYDIGIPAQALQLEKVVILRAGDKDTAVLPNNIPTAKRGQIAVRLKTAYSGIDCVIFAGDAEMERLRQEKAEDIQFDGRLYLPKTSDPALKMA